MWGSSTLSFELTDVSEVFDQRRKGRSFCGDARRFERAGASPPEARDFDVALCARKEVGRKDGIMAFKLPVEARVRRHAAARELAPRLPSALAVPSHTHDKRAPSRSAHPGPKENNPNSPRKWISKLAETLAKGRAGEDGGGSIERRREGGRTDERVHVQSEVQSEVGAWIDEI